MTQTITLPLLFKSISTTMTDRRYTDLLIGAGWISLIEPGVSHESAFNRWYSDDHFYAGGMCLPGIFAGRRWVATKALRSLRYAADDDWATHGCYLHTNLFSRHQLDDSYAALGETLQKLGSEGRMYPSEIPRRHLYTVLAPYEGVVYRDGARDGPLDIHALDYPFAGLVLEIVDAANGHSRVELLEWLRTRFIPEAIAESPALMCLVFRHADLPDIIKSPRLPLKYDEGDDGVVLLWFIEEDRRLCWESFVDHKDSVQRSGLGEVKFVGPFIPTVPGTNRYVDELR